MIIGLIPARAGSKGVPGKNFAPMYSGVPAWKLQALAAHGIVDQVVLSTDASVEDEEWIRVVKRSAHAASDSASMLDAVTDAAQALELKPDDTIVLLSVAFTRRRREDVSAIVQLCRRWNNSLIGYTDSKQHPYLSCVVDGLKMSMPFNPDVNTYYQRQRYPKVYRLCNFVCAARVCDLPSMNGQVFFDGSAAVYVEPNKTHEVDTLDELEEARKWLEDNGLP